MFIQLTCNVGTRKVLINIEHIVYVEDCEEYTRICLNLYRDEVVYRVRETATEIRNLINAATS